MHAAGRRILHPAMPQADTEAVACCMQAYAMTEAAHQMTSNPLPKNGPHKAGTVGRPQGSVRLAILDARNREAGGFQSPSCNVCMLGTLDSVLAGTPHLQMHRLACGLAGLCQGRQYVKAVGMHIRGFADTYKKHMLTSPLRCTQVPQGGIGEVCIRGPNVTKGYLNNPKANAEAYAGGGDLHIRSLRFVGSCCSFPISHCVPFCRFLLSQPVGFPAST